MYEDSRVLELALNLPPRSDIWTKIRDFHELWPSTNINLKPANLFVLASFKFKTKHHPIALDDSLH